MHPPVLSKAENFSPYHHVKLVFVLVPGNFPRTIIFSHHHDFCDAPANFDHHIMTDPYCETFGATVMAWPSLGCLGSGSEVRALAPLKK